MDMPHNPFRAALAAGRDDLLGCWLSTGSATVAEIAGGAPFDWFLIDGEHGPNTAASIQDQLRSLDAVGATSIVRPAEAHRVLIKQVLDTGAMNVLLPMVNDGEEAREVVAACRYPTAGVRGVGAGVARASRWGRWADYAERIADELCIIVQVESAAGVEHLDDILAVDGVDAVFVGPVDLASSLGTPPKDELDDLVCDLMGRIRAAGKWAGSLAFHAPTAQRYFAAGAQFVATASDTASLVAALDASVARYR